MYNVLRELLAIRFQLLLQDIKSVKTKIDYATEHMIPFWAIYTM